MKKITKKILIHFSGFLILPLIAFAQIKNPLGANNVDLPGLIDKVLNYAVYLGGILAMLAFIYTGFLFVKAQGNEAKLKDAKTVFFWTVVGVAILLGAKIISSIVVNTLKNIAK